MSVYQIQVYTLLILTAIQLTILIKKLWSFKQLETSKKNRWTFFLIVYSSLSALIFIWRQMDDYEELNKIKSA